tara:strand:- start:413 stop:1273 length:861 start_codon:yes stop_codon:yes gene_type:complete
MFGQSIDYHFLKLFTHKNNFATKEDLDRRAANRDTALTSKDCIEYFTKVQKYFNDSIPIERGLSYLDIGCGEGRISISLVAKGCDDVTGVDLEERHIVEAQTIAARSNVHPNFIPADIHNWENSKKYDVIFVLGAMEHIHSLGKFLRALGTYLKPDGRAYVSHEPFQSPIGDHMVNYFKIQIPWRGVLFSEKAILKLRRECYRPDEKVSNYSQIGGGLNQISYGKYLRLIEDAELEVESSFINPQLRLKRKYLPFVPVSKIFTRIPIVRNYFICTAYSVLKIKKKS